MARSIGLLGFALFLGASVAVADDAPGKGTTPKGAVNAGPGAVPAHFLAGRVSKVDVEGKKLTVEIGKTEKTYTIDDKTTFGGMFTGKGIDGLKNPHLVKGAIVRFDVVEGGDTLKELFAMKALPSPAPKTATAAPATPTAPAAAQPKTGAKKETEKKEGGK
jgi:hypothetical protein